MQVRVFKSPLRFHMSWFLNAYILLTIPRDRTPTAPLTHKLRMMIAHADEQWQGCHTCRCHCSQLGITYIVPIDGPDFISAGTAGSRRATLKCTTMTLAA